MNNNDTLRVQILIEYWADERYKQQAYAACRREFWEKLGQALYEADGIFTVEIDEKREWAMLPNRGGSGYLHCQIRKGTIPAREQLLFKPARVHVKVHAEADVLAED